MTLNNDDLLNSILASLDRVKYVKPSDIPNIDLYMDQVTTFMDAKLRSAARYPGEDKILTKTMINNYAKNDLLPPPEKKKYSKEHVLLLIFIYYYKGILSINDIQTLLGPLTEKFFHNKKAELSLEEIYREVCDMEMQQLEGLKADVVEKFRISEKSFPGASEENAAFLQKFAFICMLSFDVYLKKLMIEKIVDELAKEQMPVQQAKPDGKKKETKDNKGKQKV